MKALLLVALTLVGFFVIGRFLPVGEWFQQFTEEIGGMGSWGLGMFVLVYILATILLLPGTILTLGGGFAFGLAWGFVSVSVGSTLGAALAFLIGRYLMRNQVERLTAANPTFRRVDQAIGERGAILIFLLRLSPVVPYNLSNYFYGLTAVRFWPYVLASWLGMMPMTLLYVYLGTAGRAGAEAVVSGEHRFSPFEWGLLGLGLLATLTATIGVSHIARKALEKTTGPKIE